MMMPALLLLLLLCQSLPDGQTPLDNETLAKLMPGIMAGAFWLSLLGTGAQEV